MLTKERIDLHLPNGWNACTRKELEAVAQCFIDEGQRGTHGKAYDLTTVKVDLFFRLTGLEVVAPANPEVPVEDQYYLVRRKDVPQEGRWPIRRKKEQPFALYLYQIEQWTREELKWLDSHSTLTLFPYDTLRRRGRKYCGPAPLMADWTWTQYRMATDAMSYYVQQSNALAALANRMKSDKGSIPPSELKEQMRVVTKAKAMFLATIFVRRHRFVDSETKRLRRDWRYVSNQTIDNAEDFRTVSDAQWQVIQFWWEGMAHYLAGRYPKVIAMDDKKKSGKQPNPLEVYTRTVATMEKYLGVDEEQLGRQPFGVILQHLNDIIEQSEEIEKINSK